MMKARIVLSRICACAALLVAMMICGVALAEGSSPVGEPAFSVDTTLPGFFRVQLESAGEGAEWWSASLVDAQTDEVLAESYQVGSRAYISREGIEPGASCRFRVESGAEGRQSAVKSLDVVVEQPSSADSYPYIIDVEDENPMLGDSVRLFVWFAGEPIDFIICNSASLTPVFQSGQTMYYGAYDVQSVGEYDVFASIRLASGSGRRLYTRYIHCEADALGELAPAVVHTPGFIHCPQSELSFSVDRVSFADSYIVEIRDDVNALRFTEEYPAGELPDTITVDISNYEPGHYAISVDACAKRYIGSISLGNFMLLADTDVVTNDLAVSVNGVAGDTATVMVKDPLVITVTAGDAYLDSGLYDNTKVMLYPPDNDAYLELHNGRGQKTVGMPYPTEYWVFAVGCPKDDSDAEPVYSAPVRLIVAAGESEALAPPTWQSATTEVSRGDYITISGIEPASGAEYVGARLLPSEDDDGENPIGAITAAWDEASRTVSFRSGTLEPGSYSIRLFNSAAGYRTGQSEPISVVVTQPDSAADWPYLVVSPSKTTVQTGEPLEITLFGNFIGMLSVNANGPSPITYMTPVIYSDGQKIGSYYIAYATTNVCFETPGEYTITFTSDNHEIYYDVTSPVITVTGEGQLASPVIHPTTELVLGEELSFSFEAVEGAQWYTVELFGVDTDYDNPAGPVCKQNQAPGQVVFPADTFWSTGLYRVDVKAHARGVSRGLSTFHVLVRESDYGHDLTLSIINREPVDGVYSFPVGSDAILQVRTDAEVYSVEIGDGYNSVPCEIVNGVGTVPFSLSHSGLMALYASSYDGDNKLISAPLQVNVTTNGFLPVAPSFQLESNEMNVYGLLRLNNLNIDEHAEWFYVDCDLGKGALSPSGMFDPHVLNGKSLALYPYVYPDGDMTFHIRLISGAEGYEPTYSAPAEITVHGEHIPEALTMELSSTEIAAGEELYAGIYSPVSPRRLWITEGDDLVWNSNNIYDYFTLAHFYLTKAGEHRLYLHAYDGDETTTAGPFTVTVRCDGTLADPVVNAPDFIEPYDDYSFSFEGVDGATGYSVTILSSNNAEVYRCFRTEPGTVTVPYARIMSDVRAQFNTIVVTSMADNMLPGHGVAAFYPLVAPLDSRLRLTINGESGDSFRLPIGAPLQIDVAADEEIDIDSFSLVYGNSSFSQRVMQSVAGDNGESLLRYSEIPYLPGRYIVYATARFANDEGSPVVRSSPVVLNVYSNGPLPNAPELQLDTDSTMRGLPINIRILNADEPEECYYLGLFDPDGVAIPYGNTYSWNEDEKTFVLRTGGIPAGSYELCVTGELIGWEYSETRVPITITEPEAGTVALTTSCQELLVNEPLDVYACAPGASQVNIRIYKLNDSGEVSHQVNSATQYGVCADQTFSIRSPGTYRVVATATLNNGQVSTIESDPVQITVTSLGLVPFAKLSFPGTLRAGEPMPIEADIPEGVESWTIYISSGNPSSGMTQVFTADDVRSVTVPADLLMANAFCGIRVECRAYGKETNSIYETAFVYDYDNPPLTLTVNNGQTDAIPANTTVPIRVEGMADESYLLFYSGNAGYQINRTQATVDGDAWTFDWQFRNDDHFAVANVPERYGASNTQQLDWSYGSNPVALTIIPSTRVEVSSLKMPGLIFANAAIGFEVDYQSYVGYRRFTVVDAATGETTWTREVTDASTAKVIDASAFPHPGTYTVTLNSISLPYDDSVTCTVTAISPDIDGLTLPDKLTTIGEEAFRGCSAPAVRIPDTVTDIGAFAFADCEALTLVFIPDGVTEIADTAFQNSPGVVFVCSAGSTAAGYAADRGITVIPPIA